MNKFIEGLDRQFAQLHRDSHKLIEVISPELLYHQPSGRSNSLPLHSCGEHLLRSAAVVEQTFGGITANLWDDPFEWTLPEYLSTPAKINDHLAEVEAIRERAFSSFADDACLLKCVAVPSGEMRPLIDLLAETLLRAGDQQAQALVTLKSLSGISPPGFII